MPECVVRGVHLHYQQQGRGEPLLLLHCGLGTGGDFAAVIPDLAAHYRVFTPDRPGYGRSAHGFPFNGSYFIVQEEIMRGFLEAQGISWAYLWGWSDGAIIALWMAIQNPGQVRAVIVEAGHLYTRKAYPAFLFQHLEPGSLPVEEQERLARQHGPEDWRELCHDWAQMWLELDTGDEDLYAGRLGEVQVPTLILHADDDTHVPLKEIEALQAQISGARLYIFPSGGHALHVGPSQKQVLQTALAFLEEVGTAK